MISQKCEMRLKLDSLCRSCTSRWCLSSFSALSLVPSSVAFVVTPSVLASSILVLSVLGSSVLRSSVLGSSVLGSSVLGSSVLASFVLASSVLRSSRLTAKFLRNLPVAVVVDPRCSLSGSVRCQGNLEWTSPASGVPVLPSLVLHHHLSCQVGSHGLVWKLDFTCR